MSELQFWACECWVQWKACVTTLNQGSSGAGTLWNAPANIVGHRWNANTEALLQITSYSLGWSSISLFFGPNCPQTQDLASKISKNVPGVTPSDPFSGRGRPPPAPTPSTATRRARGRKLPRCWDLGLGNRSPKSQFTTTPLLWTHRVQFS